MPAAVQPVLGWLIACSLFGAGSMPAACLGLAQCLQLCSLFGAGSMPASVQPVWGWLMPAAVQPVWGWPAHRGEF